MYMKRIEKAAKHYEQVLDEADAARLRFFEELWRALDGEHIAVPEYAAPEPARLRELSGAGLPVFGDAPVAVSGPELARALAALSAAAVEHGEFMPDANDALSRTNWDRVVAASPLDKAGKNPAAFLSDFADVLVDDGMTEPQAHMAALLASIALRAQLEGPAEEVQAARKMAGLEEDHQCRCPVCGTEAAVGRVGEGGTSGGRGKTLWCPQCASVWEFDRIRCPRCGTRNPGHLHYYNVEGDDAHRIGTCDECGGYVRVLFTDAADRVPLSFEVEDVVMARLDAIANDPSIAKGEK